jgi:gliding motility-associated-like protein
MGPALSKFSLTIFDRWGQQIFTTDNQETGWDGTSKGKPCPMGVFSFISTYELSDSPGINGKISGTVTLIR